MFTAQKQIPAIIQKKIAQEVGELEINYVHQDTLEHYVSNVTYMTLEVMDHILFLLNILVDYVLIQKETF